MASSDVASNPRVPNDESAASRTRSLVPMRAMVRSRREGDPAQRGEMSGMRKSVRRGLVAGIVVVGVLLAPHAEAKSLLPRGQTIAALNASESSNWGGYNQGILAPGKSAGVTQVSATWVVPAATQHTRGEAEYSSTWVGIGGGCIDTSCTATDSTLIQAGSESDVDSSGHPTYSVWWEVIPGPGITIDAPVNAGDTVSVDIRELVPAVWTITVKVNGTTFTQSVPYPSTHATVEWIEETPVIIGTDGTGVAAMPDLAKTTFSNAKVNGANPNLIGAEEIDLVTGGKTLVKPSAPTGGNSFAVCTHTTTCS